jgi:ribonuclease BN (tRNA processing enzyme)
MQDERVVDFMREADVVIADSQYDESEYPSRLGWGHTCADDTVQLAMRARAKQLFLFHHDPDHHDQKIADMVARAQSLVKEQRSTLIVAAAREGAEVLMKNGSETAGEAQ